MFIGRISSGSQNSQEKWRNRLTEYPGTKARGPRSQLQWHQKTVRAEQCCPRPCLSWPLDTLPLLPLHSCHWMLVVALSPADWTPNAPVSLLPFFSMNTFPWAIILATYLQPQSRVSYENNSFWPLEILCRSVLLPQNHKMWKANHCLSYFMMRRDLERQWSCYARGIPSNLFDNYILNIFNFSHNKYFLSQYMVMGTWPQSQDWLYLTLLNIKSPTKS